MAKNKTADMAVCGACKKEGAERKLEKKRGRKDPGDKVMVSLEIAAADGHVKCLEALLNAGADVNYRNKKNGFTPLMWASKNGNEGCVELLIKAGADVNTTNRSSALMLASGNKGNVRCVELLLEAGADVNYSDDDGRTALIKAAGSGCTDAATLLINAGADVNKGNTEGDTALMFAAGWCHNDILTLLISAGADVNAVNETGSTAAHSFAVSRGDLKCAETLAKAGADLNFMCDGQTPLMMAVVEECVKSAQALIKAGADMGYAFHAAPGRGKAFYSMLIEAGADVNDGTSEGGQSPLMRCLDSQPDCAEMLIEAGADVNFTCDGNLPTALFRASETDSVKLLLRSGARINIPNKDGKNVLEMRLARTLRRRRGNEGREKGKKLDHLCLVLFAAGETVNEMLLADDWIQSALPDYQNLGLKRICRMKIREHLLELDPHAHLFYRVPSLGLPDALTDYLLFNISIEKKPEEMPASNDV